VTAIAITTCGRSVRESLECPNARLPCSVGQLVGDVDLPVGGGRVHEDQIQIKVQQMRDRGEHLSGDVVQRARQEVHRGVGGVVGEARAALDRDPLGNPLRAGELATRFEGALRDEGEHHPLDHLTVQPPAGRGLPDTEPFPDPLQRPRPSQATGVQDLHLRAVSPRRRPPRG